MPFKTRQQKISAEARRFSFALTQIKFPIQKSAESEGGKNDFAVRKNIANLDYVRGDLFKILVIASAVIIVQIGLALTLS